MLNWTLEHLEARADAWYISNVVNNNVQMAMRILYAGILRAGEGSNCKH